MEQTDKLALRNVILAVLLAVACSRLSIASIFMTLPILMACYDYKDARKAVFPFILVLAIVTVWTLVQNKMIFQTEYQGILALGLFPPFVSIIGSALWLYVRDKSTSLLRKFFWACIPAYVISLALAFYFASSASENVRMIYAESVLYYFPQEVLNTISLDIASIARASVDMLALIFAPMAVILLGLPILVCDSMVHKFDDKWQEDFTDMKFPDYYAWIFLVSLAFMLLSNWIEMPTVLKALVWNTALFWLLLYFIVGSSILAFMARKKNPTFRASRIMSTLVLMCFIPGLNILVLIGVPILGVLETWIKIRQ